MIRIARAAGVLATSVLGACSAAPRGAGGAEAATPLPSAREERVLVPSFDIVEGVAASQRRVYIASPDGIAALDRDLGQWLPPVTRLDGWPGGPLGAIAADPLEDGVWVAGAGALAYWRPTLDQLSLAALPGPVDAILFDQRDIGAGAYLRGSTGLALATRTGLVMPVSSMSLPPGAALERAPTLADVWQRY
ncbi:MAG TPA: hypothetical protein VFS44_05430, partial [Gemmatimonadaceae bacterium]|nr:hypothetical protein [Gemmatimonadaceae bacterium]